MWNAILEKEQLLQKAQLSDEDGMRLAHLENEIAELELKKNELESVLNSGELHHDELYQKSEELTKIKTLLDEKEFRWLELSELQ